MIIKARMKINGDVTILTTSTDMIITRLESVVNAESAGWKEGRDEIKSLFVHMLKEMVYNDIIDMDTDVEIKRIET